MTKVTQQLASMQVTSIKIRTHTIRSRQTSLFKRFNMHMLVLHSYTDTHAYMYRLLLSRNGGKTVKTYFRGDKNSFRNNSQQH